MSPSSAATVALRLICAQTSASCAQTSALWSWSRSPGHPRSSTAAWGPPAPITRSAGEDPWDSARSFPRSSVSKTGARRAGSIPARLPESHQDAGFEQGFSSRESGHFRICRKDFWPRHDSSHTVTARAGPAAAGCGAGHRHRGAVIVTAIGPDALVCGGQRAADPALAPGDWLSGRAPRSHRGGHWFDPSIAHPSDLR